MNLIFEYDVQAGTGANPCGYHTADNEVQILYADSSGNISVTKCNTPEGLWTNVTFDGNYKVSDDVAITNLKTKFQSDALYLVWKNLTESGEVVPYVENVVHTHRHRYATWAHNKMLSSLLVSGDLQFNSDDPVSSVSIEFENPNYSVSHEDETMLTPGTCLALYFRSGDSEPYEMGRYYIDSNRMTVNENTVSVEGRNAIGKFLKDQTFDENHTYPSQNLQQTFQAILDNFDVKNYWVGGASFNVGMEFPPDMNGYDGVIETLKTVRNWKIEEGLDGTIGVGFITDDRFPQASTYVFNRDTDVFSRSVTRDDQDAYSRVCVHNNDYSIAVYKDVAFRFVMGRKKTLYVSLAEGTVLADAEAYATELAGMLGSSGIIETFSGPFRPYIQVGDNAKIIGRNSKLLGMITEVRHQFGRNGFTTEFTVDSGQMANRTKVSDYINKITGKNTTTGQTKRLY